MSLWILANHGGYLGTALYPSGEAATGYSLVDIVTGPRSTRYRSQASSGDRSAGYEFGSDVVISHVVVARADWMLTQNGSRVRARQRNSGGTWSVVSGIDLNPLSSANLVGPTSQDLVLAVSPSDHRGSSLFRSGVSGSEALQVAKVFASSGLYFGLNPTPGFSWQDLPDNQFAFPIRGNRVYEVERRFALNWLGITQANLNSFLALPMIDRWPLFLYDDAGDVFPWKLEHVIVENYTVNVIAADNINLEVSFARLKHWR